MRIEDRSFFFSVYFYYHNFWIISFVRDTGETFFFRPFCLNVFYFKKSAWDSTVVIEWQSLLFTFIFWNQHFYFLRSSVPCQRLPSDPKPPPFAISEGNVFVNVLWWPLLQDRIVCFSKVLCNLFFFFCTAPSTVIPFLCTEHEASILLTPNLVWNCVNSWVFCYFLKNSLQKVDILILPICKPVFL